MGDEGELVAGVDVGTAPQHPLFIVEA